MVVKKRGKGVYAGKSTSPRNRQKVGSKWDAERESREANTEAYEKKVSTKREVVGIDGVKPKKEEE